MTQIRVKQPPTVPPQDRAELADRVAVLTSLADRVTSHAVAHTGVRTSGLAVAQNLYRAAASLREALENGVGDVELYGVVLVCNEAAANAGEILQRENFSDQEERAVGPRIAVAAEAVTP
jgi:hypothetical protein